MTHCHPQRPRPPHSTTHNDDTERQGPRRIAPTMAPPCPGAHSVTLGLSMHRPTHAPILVSASGSESTCPFQHVRLALEVEVELVGKFARGCKAAGSGVFASHGSSLWLARDPLSGAVFRGRVTIFATSSSPAGPPVRTRAARSAHQKSRPLLRPRLPASNHLTAPPG